jgi:hypothetical protein
MNPQSATQSAASGIPTNVSQGCSTFLTTLDSNAAINGCLNSLIDATSDFDPTNSNSSTPSTGAVTTTLNNICAASFNQCDESTIRGMLANFYTACSTDMLGTNGDGSNGNKNVIDIYDVLYLISPLKSAICTKSGNQYCVNVISQHDSGSNSASSSVAAADSGNGNGSDSTTSQTVAAASSQGGSSSPAAASSSSSSSASSSHSVSTSTSSRASAASPSASAHAKRTAPYPVSSLYKRSTNVLARRDQNTLDTIAPEAAQYNTIGLPYLFITPNLTQAELCTPCTSSVVGSYISFESITPYALGIANSPMLSGQVTLWNKIKSTCPQDFTTGLLNNATGSSSSSEDNASAAFRGVQFGALSQFVGAAVVALLGGTMLF